MSARIPAILFLSGALIPIVFLTGSGRHPLSFSSGGGVTFTGPAQPTAAEVSAFMDAVHHDGTLPEGWVLDDWSGRWEIIPTGIWTWRVTVADDPEDLSSMTVVLYGLLRKEATRESGGIVDRDGLSIASVDLIAPALGMRPRVEISWTGDDGRSQRVETSLGR